LCAELQNIVPDPTPFAFALFYLRASPRGPAYQRDLQSILPFVLVQMVAIAILFIFPPDRGPAAHTLIAVNAPTPTSKKGPVFPPGLSLSKSRP